MRAHAPSSAPPSSHPLSDIATGRTPDDNPAGRARWHLAQTAVVLLQIAPGALGGILVSARHGPVRSAWRAHLTAAFADSSDLVTIPAHVSRDRLTGGVDLAATLSTGRLTRDEGLLAAGSVGAAGATGSAGPRPKLLLIEGHERQDAANLSLIAQTLQSGASARGTVRAAGGTAVILFDEADDPEVATLRRQAPDSACEHAGIWINLENLAHRVCGETIARPSRSMADLQRQFHAIEPADKAIAAVSDLAMAFGISGFRPVFACLAAARAHAVLRERRDIEPQDLEVAVALTLAPRATRLPAPPEDATDEQADPPPAQDREPECPPEAEQDNPLQRDTSEGIDDRLIEAMMASLPPNVLEQLAAGLTSTRTAQSSGASGAKLKHGQRGHAFGSRRGTPNANIRLNLVETLRAAAPWQPFRRAQQATGLSNSGLSNSGLSNSGLQAGKTGPRVFVRRDDFRVYRRRDQTETLAIFVVDASGSAAVKRLGEAKGAIELMLAESYARRDCVALVGVRGRSAEVLVPPTRSLTRARRCLAGLPGGGGTPLAGGLDAARELAVTAARRGQQPMLVILTDGQANVDRAGQPGRKQAEADALSAGTALRLEAVPSLLIDTSFRPQARAEALADAMAGRYLAMPRSDARGVAGAASGFVSDVRSTSSTSASRLDTSRQVGA